jgi:SAM-dependent methyltransferase
MNLQMATQAVLRNLRENGLRTTLRKATGVFAKATPEPLDDFDIKNGTDTSGLVPLWKLSIAAKNVRFCKGYRPIEPWELETAVKALDEDITSFTFVDLGCGKGRPLLIAGRLGFRRVIGVEFAAELAAIARRNIQKMGLTNASVVHGDATEFAFPEGDLVVFLFNPFGPELMAKVAANLELRRHGKLYVIYVKPYFGHIFDASRGIKRLGTTAARVMPTIIWKLAPDQGQAPQICPSQFTEDPS